MGSKSCLEYLNVKDGLNVYKCVKCVYCEKNHENEFHEDLAKIFESTYRFCDENINNFCLVLGKVVSS